MKPSDHYAKIVYWSDEDGRFLGSCPDLCGPCCHGEDPKLVFEELCEIVEEWIEILKQDGKPLPPVTVPPFVERTLAEAA
jgi:predicted RNase H-like HicB family nuclease